MNNTYKTLNDFSFSDGHPLNINWNGYTLIMTYENWEENIYKFTFENVAYLESYGGGASNCEAEIITDINIISQDIKMLENDWATNNQNEKNNLMKLIISDDIPILSIIFQDVKIEKQNQS